MNEIAKLLEDFSDNNEMRLPSGPVSFQIVQEIYAKLKKKTERLFRAWDKHCVLEIPHLEQLNKKIEQYFESLKVVAHECSVTVYHKDKMEEVHSSFDRFRIYNKSCLSPVEYVEIEYNYLILLPKTKEARTYTIKLRAFSELVVFEKMKADGVPSSYRRRMLGSTIVCTIHYVDYVIANTLMNIINDWIGGIPDVEEPGWLKVLEPVALEFPILFQWILASFALLASLRCVRMIFENIGESGVLVCTTILVTFSFIYLTFRLGSRLGVIARESIVSLLPACRLNMNCGDEILAKKFEKNNKAHLVQALGAISLEFFLGISTSFSYDILKIIIEHSSK